MHTIETLLGKKAALVAQRDQLMGQFNMTNGAIAMVDELLGEMQREAETQAQLDQVAKDMAQEAREKALDQEADAWSASRDLIAAPEMLPVSHFEACAACPHTIDCEDRGCRNERVVDVVGASA